MRRAYVFRLRPTGRQHVALAAGVEAHHTSDRCERCGHAARANRVTQAEFACHGCGHTAPADEHAARNILRAGLAHHAHAA